MTTAKGGRTMRLTAAEDRCFERMANACNAKFGCATCPDERACQGLADKVITRVRLITHSGVRRVNHSEATERVAVLR